MNKEIRLRKIDYAINCIQRAIDRLEGDRFTPARKSPEVADYLIGLSQTHTDDASGFADFVVSLPYDSIHTELLRQILPDAIRERITSARNEHDLLQAQKETEIADGKFENARDYRDRQDLAARSINALTAGVDLNVTPNHIRDTLDALGWQR